MTSHATGSDSRVDGVEQVDGVESHAGQTSQVVARPGASSRRSSAPTEVLLYSGRVRLLLVAAIQLALGGLLLFSLGTIGQYIGGILIAFGLLRVLRVVRIGLGAEGVITLAKRAAGLPRKLCGGQDNIDSVETSDILNVFYLRRSLSWIRSSPVLVVETSDRAYRYPRSWFASDYDQRRIGFAFNRALGRSLPKNLVSPPRPALIPSGELTDSDRRNRAVVLFILAGGLVMRANLGLHGFLITLGLPTYIVYVAAGLSIAAGLFYLFVPATPPDTGSEKPVAKPKAEPIAKARVAQSTSRKSRGKSAKSKRK